MIIEKLIKEFIDSSVGELIIPQLKSEKLQSEKLQELYFHGITDSAKGFFLTALLYSLKRPVLYLASDSNAALNFYHEILNLTESISHKLPIFYFCAQEVSPYDQISSDPEVISHQTKTLLQLINKKDESALIISTTRYLSEKVWNKNDLQNGCFTISADTEIEPSELAKKLIVLGYKKNTTVTSRGEFSIRGDIFDIFPLIEHPTRIEFFGNKIDSLRIYSTTTQRSQENVDSITITPRYYVINPNINILKEKINRITNWAHSLTDLVTQETDQLQINTYTESLEYYAQTLNQRGSSLFDYLTNKALIVVDDWEANGISLEAWYQRNLEIKNDLEKANKIIPLPKLLLNDPEYILKNLSNYSKSYIERFELFDFTKDKSISLQLEAALRFHNQIDKLAEKIREWLSLNFKIIIFSDQPQRVKGILREWNIDSSYTDELKEEDYSHHHIFISKEGTINGFSMNFAKTIVLTDQEIFGTKRKPTLIKKSHRQEKSKHDYYANIEDLKPNDYVVHIKHGIGKYRGLVKISIDNVEKEYLLIEYASDGKLYLPVEQINLLFRYRGSAEIIPKLSRLGGSDWELTKKKVKKAVKKIAEDLLNLYTARSKLEGFSFQPDSHWQLEMEEAFPYTETPDQWQSICDVKKDMESTKPMDRLICGDVGYGKTEVALRAIFKAVLSGKQVAILVPTTILAQQHYNVISERLAPYSTRIGLLSRFISPKEQKLIITKLGLGEIDVVIGTHRLLQKDVIFKDLGLVVIDEEQRFGVIHKEKLKHLRVSVDVITLSATPIPRTLHMALSGARDMSLINTAPANRLPIKTFIGEFKPTLIKTAILHELERGGQVYFIHNRVESIINTSSYVKELVPEAKVAIAHGQMLDKELEGIMFDFLQKKYNVLICTTIIESGIDIPNVNTIIIDNADQMGLAQLYQLRGRVGRSEVQAYAYCLYQEDKILTETAKNRLQAIKEFSSLGSGYQIALRDMEIRGVGNLLGAEQHGHMISVGFDFYCELLNEAVDKLRGLEVHDKEIETLVDLNINAYIPNTFIDDEQQKVIEYKRLANVKNTKELEYISSEWKDRFGNLPPEVENLIKIVELRILANQLEIKNIKSEPSSSTIKIELNLRLQKWLGIQSHLPKAIINRTSFKSVVKGGNDLSYIQLKVSGLDHAKQLEVLFDLLHSLKVINLKEKIA